MKNLAVILFVFTQFTLFSQPTPKLKVQGGIFIGSNGNTTLMGLPGPKISSVFYLKKLNLEVGVTGIPGIFLEKENNRLGLSMGPTIIFSGKEKKTPKVIVGVVFFKTKVWYAIPGIGVVF